MSSGASRCLQINANVAEINKLKKNISNFKRYPNGCGIRRLGSAKKPIEEIVMASTITYQTSLVFQPSGGGSVLILGATGGAQILGTVAGNVDASAGDYLIVPNVPNTSNVVAEGVVKGSVIYDLSVNQLKYYNGTTWLTPVV